VIVVVYTSAMLLRSASIEKRKRLAAASQPA
jgi:hypothetical protein